MLIETISSTIIDLTIVLQFLIFLKQKILFD